jgi:transcription antitermination factor NusG
MLKCQICDQPATHHVTEIVAGEPRDYHLCEKHLQNWEHLPEQLPPWPKSGGPGAPLQKLLNDAKLLGVLQDPAVRQEMAAHLLPALCLALLHEKAEMRVAAIFSIMRLGSDVRSASGALRDALKDSDERVATAAQLALEYMESDQAREGMRVPGIAPPKPKYDRGDRVKVKVGTFAKREGEVKDILETKGLVRVELTIFDRPVPVELEYWQVEPL